MTFQPDRRSRRHSVHGTDRLHAGVGQQRRFRALTNSAERFACAQGRLRDVVSAKRDNLNSDQQHRGGHREGGSCFHQLSKNTGQKCYEWNTASQREGRVIENGTAVIGPGVVGSVLASELADTGLHVHSARRARLLS